jgi:hypothetical protein
MAVYVDPIMTYGGSATFPWSRSCHMYADTTPELHQFAERIGLKRSWFQDKSVPHYDLVASKRVLAVRQGAVEHTVRDAVTYWRDRGWTGQRKRRVIKRKRTVSDGGVRAKKT